MPVTIFLDTEVEEFYRQLAEAVGLPVEQVLADALFKLAGELSLTALKNQDLFRQVHCFCEGSLL